MIAAIVGLIIILFLFIMIGCMVFSGPGSFGLKMFIFVVYIILSIIIPLAIEGFFDFLAKFP
jgi:hypothetical protein